MKSEVQRRAVWSIKWSWMVALVPALIGAACAQQGATLAGKVEPSRQRPAPPLTAKGPDAVVKARAQTAYARLPLHFEANHGQADPEVKFLSRGGGYTLFLTPAEAVLTLRNGPGGTGTAQRAVLRMKLVGANPEPQVNGLEELPGKANYFIGNDRNKWRANVPTYASVRYENVYPGIDLVYYGNQRRLEHDFVVAPGADPKVIRLVFEGADSIEIDARGDLVLQTPGGEVRLNKPYVYQLVNGVKQTIPSDYVFTGTGDILHPGSRLARFQVGPYDATSPLIIDPVLIYSTYLGGTGSDEGTDIAADALGNAYVAGLSGSVNDFPSPEGPGNAFKPQPALGGTDVFVAKLDPTGSALVYSAYLGGADADGGDASVPHIAVTGGGEAYVAGQTCSFDDLDNPNDGFPKAHSLTQVANSINVGAGMCDAFVAKLNSDGSALVYSTYLGGSLLERLFGIALDPQGNAYVAGQTKSPDFPTTPGNAYDTTCCVNDQPDIFVSKLEFDASTFVLTLSYSTYLGKGFETNLGYGIAVDTNGLVYVAARTDSPFDFPVGFPPLVNAYDATCGSDGFCDNGNADIFVAVLRTDPATCELDLTNGINCKESLIRFTYLGGTGEEAPSTRVGIALDGLSNVYVTSDTNSNDFPAGNACAAMQHFVVKLNAQLTTLLYFKCDVGSDKIAVDSPGENIYLSTGKLNLSTDKVEPYPLDFGGPGARVALDASCNVYATGNTIDPKFPTRNPFQPALGSMDKDAFVQKIARHPFAAYISNHTANTVSVIADTNVGETAIDVQSKPHGVAVSPDGRHVYVANFGSNTVSVIDTTTNTVIKTVSLGVNLLQPVGVAVTLDGTRVYVANSAVDTATGKHVISVIDTTTNERLDLDPGTDGIQQVELTIKQANVPFGIAVSPDGTRLYVTNQAGHFVTVINVDTTTAPPTHTFLKRVDVGDGEWAGVAVSPDSKWVYVARGDGVVAVISAEGDPQLFLKADLGGRLFGVAAHPTDPKVYVTNFLGNTLKVLDFHQSPPLPPDVTTVPVGNGPRGVAVTLDGFVYVANFGNNTVSIYDSVTKKVIKTVGVGVGPIAFGQFIGSLLDKDGDGIDDLIDGALDVSGNFVPQSGNPDNKSFTNRHLCGTVSGSIGFVPPGMGLLVMSPAGIVIGAFGGAGQAMVTTCGFVMVLDENKVAAIDSCSSLTTQVLSGPVEILLDSAGVVRVPTGVTVRVAKIAEGQFEVQNLGGFGTIIVEFQGQVTQVGPGGTGIFSPDSDGDGVADHKDQCQGTPAGKAADANGCSGEQLVNLACPCAGPASGGTWNSHGSYVSCVTREVEKIAKSGLITQKDKGPIVSEAARSTCGQKK